MSPILVAFDRALAEVDRARRAGLRRRDGGSADAELDALRLRLTDERARAASLGRLDVAAIGALVREVAVWYPEDRIQLIAALGAIVSTSD